MPVGMHSCLSTHVCMCCCHEGSIQGRPHRQQWKANSRCNTCIQACCTTSSSAVHDAAVVHLLCSKLWQLVKQAMSSFFTTQAEAMVDFAKAMHIQTDCTRLSSCPTCQKSVYVHMTGLSTHQADEVETSLMAMPTVHMAAKCVVDGEESEEIMETDIVTCAARVVLTRHSHLAPGILPKAVNL